MRRRASILLTIILACATAASGLANIGAPHASKATIVAPAAGSAASPRSDRSPTTGAARLRTPPTDRRRERGTVTSWRDLCTGPHSIRLTQSKLCTHGPDDPPPGFARNQPVPALSARSVRRETAGIPCAGDGESSFRVQVLYVRGSDVPSRYATMLPSIRAWAGSANLIVQQSAAATGGSRSLRFVHDLTCLPIVDEVVLSPRGDDDFPSVISELQDRGYDRSDRIYLSFVDTTAAGICGIGSLWSDDRASADNWNNFGPSYARVDAWCWSGDVAAHELMHNLGAVQLSAPNSSGGFHCIDEYDVMCYRDSARSPAMRYDCPEALYDATRFDCGHQDYYNTSPAADSYLANFWNAANNQFLIGAPDNPPPTDNTATTKQKHGKEHKKHKKRHHRH